MFFGDKKYGRSFLHSPEQKLISFLVPKIPLWLRTEHLTLLTVLWSLLVIIFSYLARNNFFFLSFVSAWIFFQWITDALDGAVGRFRKRGLKKWGFYMDHFLDYVFLSSIIIGYAIIVQKEDVFYMLLILALFSGFMVNSFLFFAATNKFKIVYYGIGPTEVRLLFILINLLLIFFGKVFISEALPFVLAASFIGLCIVVFNSQKTLYYDDINK